GSRPPGEGVPGDDGDDRADRGSHDRAEVERAVDRVGVEQGAGEEAADQGAHDPEHDVPDHAEALIAADEEAGQVAGNGAEDDPSNDAHSVTSVPSWVGRSRAWGLGSIWSSQGPSTTTRPACPVAIP